MLNNIADNYVEQSTLITNMADEPLSAMANEEISNMSASGNSCWEQQGQMDSLKLFTYISEAYIEPIIFGSGIITNILAFVTLRRMSISHSVRALLCALCLTDFLTSFCGFLGTVLEVILFCGDMVYGQFSSGVITIFVIFKLYLMFLAMSSTLLIFTSILRTYSILKPFDWRNTFSKRRTVKISASMMVIIFVMFWPNGFYIIWKSCFEEITMDHSNTSTVSVCKNLEDNYHLVTIGNYTRFYFGLIAIILGPGTVIGNTICLFILKRAIKKSINDILHMQKPKEYSDTDPETRTQLKKSMKVNSMFQLVLFINTVCIAPSCMQVVSLLIDPQLYIFNKSPSVAIIDIIAEMFLSILSSYNFWLYLCINKEFRRTFKQIFWPCSRDKTTNSTESWEMVAQRKKPGRLIYKGVQQEEPM